MFLSIFDPQIPIYVVLASIISLIVSITFHEFCHAITADKLGDPTPRGYGRVSLNPAVHFDPIGFIAVLFLPFGWGRPVPINPLNFKNPRVGDVISTFMGPFANFILIVVGILVAKILYIVSAGSHLGLYSTIETIIGIFITKNLILMIFNLFPIPPLDGYHVAGFLLPHNIKDSIDDFFARQNFVITLVFIFIVSQLLSPLTYNIYAFGVNVISWFL